MFHQTHQTMHTKVHAIIVLFLMMGITIQAQKSGELIGVPDLKKNQNIYKAPFRMVLVPSGTFIFGNENTPVARPLKQTTIASFYMGTTEVTNRQYCDFLNDNAQQEELKSWIDYGNGNSKIKKVAQQFMIMEGFDNHPVTRVSWEGARAFCKWHSTKMNELLVAEGLPAQPDYRLPTEAEWEYAAKSGLIEKHPIEKRAWFKSNADDMMQAVKTKKKNSLKIYDLEGNVEEWCLDTYTENYLEKVTDANPAIGIPKLSIQNRKVVEDKTVANRVCKGGSYTDDIEQLLPHQRRSRKQQEFYNEVGFRMVQTIIDRSASDLK